MNIKTLNLHAVGQTYHGFRVTKATELPELQCFLRELVHDASGAQIMHISNDDPENLFCLSFQTLPSNSNGVAHILEHTVLCGSKKYPVKDPFFAMQRRSLNTFMNALTGADFTCYPAASQVHKDFYNLLEVYLDAVFHPILNEYSFLQEGHRLEFASPSDPTSPLEFKGIVYNEMKGAMSSPSSRLSEYLHAALFPDVTYGVNSGGDPKEIPTLTYEQLKEFHQTYYHPSRCLFFFYGNMPLEPHLDFIAQHTLNQTKRQSPLPKIPDQVRYKEPIQIEKHYPINEEEEISDKTIIAFAWLTCHILEQQETLALTILEIILLGTDASPLKMALLKSGLCKQVNSFIDSEINEIPWGIILKGCNKQSLENLETVLFQTLQEICYQPLSIETIENSIHQLEFQRSEIQSDQNPFGLSLFFRSGLLKQHDAEPEKGLLIHSLFEKIRKSALEDPEYFAKLIQKYLLNNPHFVKLALVPDKTLSDKESKEEKETLQKIRDGLSKKQERQIVEKANQLTKFQKDQEDEDFDVLPKVTLSDISSGTKEFSLSQEKIGPLSVFHHNTFTNDIVYADIFYDLPDLEEHELPYLRLFSVMLPQVASGHRTYQENLDYLLGNTGGISVGVNINQQVHDSSLCRPSINLKGKALRRKSAKLFSLLSDTVTSARFDDIHRFKEILMNHFTSLESRMNQSAIRYAINLSSSGINVPCKIVNHLYGLNYYYLIRNIVNDFDKEGPYALAKMQNLQDKLLQLDNPHLVLSCDSSSYDEIKSHGFYGLKDLPTMPFKPWKGDYPVTPIVSQGRIISSPVASVGLVIPTVSYLHPLAPALSIVPYLFDSLTLHTKIREQGGAYGGGAINHSLSGNFCFYSYRDPNIMSTLEAFQEAIKTILEGNFDDEELEEAKLEMIQALDTPISPCSRAEIEYIWLCEGKTVERRQAFRNHLLKLTREEIIDAVKLIIAPNISYGATVVFADKFLLEKANHQLSEKGMALLKIEPLLQP